MTVDSGAVDYLCNGFTPEKADLWDQAIASTGIAVKVRRDPTDAFCEPEEMVARMDEVGVATLCLPTGDIGEHGTLNPYDFEQIATRWDLAERLAERYPGRFVSLMVVSASHGMAGVREARARLADPWVAGFYLHTHSWDRPFDHADYYPYYALASEENVPFVMQAGTSGGLMASECGRPIGVDRPALYFPETRFVLSHLGWPWTEEAIAMALKFPNVYLGTAAYPPRHWSAVVKDFLRGPGRAKTLFGTNFPTVGHRHALAQVGELDLRPDIAESLLGGTARRVFTRLTAGAAAGASH